VLGPRGREHRQRLAVEEGRGAQVRLEHEVHALRRHLADRRAHPDAGVVDEHVEPAVGVPMGGDDPDDLLLAREVRGHLLDLEPLAE